MPPRRRKPGTLSADPLPDAGVDTFANNSHAMTPEILQRLKTCQAECDEAHADLIQLITKQAKELEQALRKLNLKQVKLSALVSMLTA